VIGAGSLKLAIAISLATTTVYGPAREPLDVQATLPFKIKDPRGEKNFFRIAFRVTSTTGTDVPVTAIRFGSPYGPIDQAFGWEAMSLAGTSCVVRESNLKGIEVWGRYPNPKDSLPELSWRYKETPWVVSPKRPSVIVADFDCDGAIADAEIFDIQIRIYARVGQVWRPVNFTFQEKRVGPQRS